MGMQVDMTAYISSCHVYLCFVQYGDVELWTRPILPAGSQAFVVLNLGANVPQKVAVKLTDLGLNRAAQYNVTEVFDDKFIGTFKPDDELTVVVNPSGVFFGKAVCLG